MNSIFQHYFLNKNAGHSFFGRFICVNFRAKLPIYMYSIYILTFHNFLYISLSAIHYLLSLYNKTGTSIILLLMIYYLNAYGKNISVCFGMQFDCIEIYNFSQDEIYACWLQKIKLYFVCLCHTDIWTSRHWN